MPSDTALRDPPGAVADGSRLVTEQGPIREISVQDLWPLVEAGDAVLVDVRMDDEYAAGHVPGALLVPLPELPGRLEQIPAADTLYVICRSGARSRSACEFLISNGRPSVNVAGGTLAWISADHPIATGPEAG